MSADDEKTRHEAAKILSSEVDTMKNKIDELRDIHREVHNIELKVRMLMSSGLMEWMLSTYQKHGMFSEEGEDLEAELDEYENKSFGRLIDTTDEEFTQLGYSIYKEIAHDPVFQSICHIGGDEENAKTNSIFTEIMYRFKSMITSETIAESSSSLKAIETCIIHVRHCNHLLGRRPQAILTEYRAYRTTLSRLMMRVPNPDFEAYSKARAMRIIGSV